MIQSKIEMQIQDRLLQFMRRNKKNKTYTHQVMCIRPWWTARYYAMQMYSAYPRLLKKCNPDQWDNVTRIIAWFDLETVKEISNSGEEQL